MTRLKKACGESEQPVRVGACGAVPPAPPVSAPRRVTAPASPRSTKKTLFQALLLFIKFKGSVYNL